MLRVWVSRQQQQLKANNSTQDKYTQTHTHSLYIICSQIKSNGCEFYICASQLGLSHCTPPSCSPPPFQLPPLTLVKTNLGKYEFLIQFCASSVWSLFLNFLRIETFSQQYFSLIRYAKSGRITGWYTPHTYTHARKRTDIWTQSFAVSTKLDYLY